MRSLVYYVAVTVDGFIAGPDGSTDFFPMQPDTIHSLFARYPETCPAHLRDALGVTASARRFDCVLLGANTHRPAVQAGLTSAYPHLDQYVVTHQPVPDDPTVTVVRSDPGALVRDLKKQPGQDIWLCGGANLAGQLIEQIDEFQLKINPVLIGTGIRLVDQGFDPVHLRLEQSQALPGGVVLNTYRRRIRGRTRRRRRASD